MVAHTTGWIDAGITKEKVVVLNIAGGAKDSAEGERRMKWQKRPSLDNLRPPRTTDHTILQVDNTRRIKSALSWMSSSWDENAAQAESESRLQLPLRKSVH